LALLRTARRLREDDFAAPSSSFVLPFKRNSRPHCESVLFPPPHSRPNPKSAKIASRSPPPPLLPSLPLLTCSTFDSAWRYRRPTLHCLLFPPLLDLLSPYVGRGITLAHSRCDLYAFLSTGLTSPSSVFPHNDDALEGARMADFYLTTEIFSLAPPPLLLKDKDECHSRIFQSSFITRLSLPASCKPRCLRRALASVPSNPSLSLFPPLAAPSLGSVFLVGFVNGLTPEYDIYRSVRTRSLLYSPKSPLFS